MNSFRLVLCGAGLLAYFVTKHFTAPEEHAVPASSANQLLGVRLPLLDEHPDPAMLAWVSSSSNSVPSLLRASIHDHSSSDSRVR